MTRTPGNTTAQGTPRYTKSCSVVLPSWLERRSSPSIHQPEVPGVCFWLRHCREADLHRGRVTAHEPALDGSRPQDPLDLSDEGLTQPFGYWGGGRGADLSPWVICIQQDLSLSWTPDGNLPYPFETCAIWPQVRIHFLQSKNQQFAPEFLRGVLTPLPLPSDHPLLWRPLCECPPPGWAHR